ncbi:MAG: exodeoxyribonuclease V subunit alpha [Casimicrobiaceae bacterium]
MDDTSIERSLPEHTLAQAFAERVARWAHDRHAPVPSTDAARGAAYAVSMAVSSGHTCVPLARIAGDGDVAALRARLADSRVVGAAADGFAFPLVVDATGRLYLARYFDYEARLARAVAHRVKAPSRSVSPAASAMLEAQFGRDGATGQKLAAALALLRNLTIVSGGPGTGKTTTVVKLLACLLADNAACRVALAAPTGKAAARLTEAITAFRSGVAPPLRDRLPAAVSTVHRLLGVYGDGRGFRHDASHPLPFDAVVVDEASMLDLALATRLVEAVPKDARLLLVGDKHQLSAVEAGAVFAELSAGVAFTPACAAALAVLTGASPAAIAAMTHNAGDALSDSVIWLTENFRFSHDSGIGRVATAVNAGDAAGATATLRDDVAANVRWIDDAGVTPAGDTLATIASGYAGFVDAMSALPLDPAQCFAAFGRFRVLCAERRGPRGAEGINAAMARRVREAVNPVESRKSATAPDDDAWFVGRPVMVRANDYLQNLFNGDVGLTLPDETGALRIWFPMADGGLRPIAPARLPAHETAFATTVHKAQGSEFDDVLLLLPSQPSRVVTRELLYTAITRARRRVTIAAGVATLEAAIATPTARDSGLVDRLRDALTSPSSSPPSPPSSA